MNTSSRLPGWTAGWILAVRMASSCIACCIFHIISIPFNCSDKALRVTDAKIGPKVKIFVFRYVCFVSRIWRQNSSPGSLAFSYLGNRAKIISYEPKAKFIPVTEPARSTGLISRGPKNVNLRSDLILAVLIHSHTRNVIFKAKRK